MVACVARAMVICVPGRYNTRVPTRRYQRKIFIFTSFYYVHGVKRCLFSTFTMTQVDRFSQIVGCRVVLRLRGILGVFSWGVV